MPLSGVMTKVYSAFTPGVCSSCRFYEHYYEDAKMSCDGRPYSCVEKGHCRLLGRLIDPSWAWRMGCEHFDGHSCRFCGHATNARHGKTYCFRGFEGWAGWENRWDHWVFGEDTCDGWTPRSRELAKAIYQKMRDEMSMG